MFLTARRAARLGLLALFAAGAAGLSGCSGGPKASAAGSVTFKGKPVTSGSVVMIGPDNEIRHGDISPDGTYKVEDVASGAVKVGVSSPNPSTAGPPADGGRGSANKAPAPPKGWVPLPAKYAQPDSSQLTAALNPGPNTHDIKLD